MIRNVPKQENAFSRRSFVGGSDARIIMGNDETDLIHLWQEKRGEVSHMTSPATSLSSLGSRPSPSIAGGSSEIQDRRSRTSSGG
jgi:predicted phage-related endonuclease